MTWADRDLEEAFKVRQSFAAAFDNCPLAARLDRDGADYSTHAQGRGTIVHSFAERVIRHCVEEGEQTYDSHMAKDLMGEAIRVSGLALPAAEFDQLMDFAWRFAAERSFDVENVVDLETTYQLVIGGVTLTGKPDYIAIADRVCEVRDWKTSWNIDPDSHVRGTFQGRLYARMMLEAFPQIAAVRVVIDYLRWGAEREATLTRSDVPDLDAYLLSLVHRIVEAERSGDWEASPGSWCAYCPRPSACPIPEEERGEGSVVTPEAAADTARWVVATEAQLKQRKAALKAYAANDEHPREPLTVGDLTFGFAQRADSESCKDKDVLRAAMDRADIDWDEHWKVRKGYTEFRARKAAA